MRRCEFEVEGLSTHRVVDKLRTAGIDVLSAHKTQKNGIRIAVNGKDRKKAFAILRGTCYNVTKVRFLRLERPLQAAIRSVGILVGAAVAIAGILFFQSRVLRIEVTGSGAYYEAEVLEILSRGGVTAFSPAPRETAALSSQILALPRVSFCSLKTEGGVLTVTVEVSDEGTRLTGEPLLAPVSGVVEELVVVRGTALVAVGDGVTAGDALVGNYILVNEASVPVLVIARASICFSVSAEYRMGEAQALAQAYLDYGELTDVSALQTENGFLITGTAHREVSINLG